MISFKKQSIKNYNTPITHPCLDMHSLELRPRYLLEVHNIQRIYGNQIRTTFNIYLKQGLNKIILRVHTKMYMTCHLKNALTTSNRHP